MLKKIISISNLGKFKNYNATGDTEFKKISLIYADNGQGKTTITSIFRSLIQPNPQILLGRKTLGQQDVPSVSLRFETKNINFQTSNWSEQYKNFEIFDTKFIQENVYIGDHVEIETKRSLYKFVVGEAGVGLANLALIFVGCLF